MFGIGEIKKKINKLENSIERIYVMIDDLIHQKYFSVSDKLSRIEGQLEKLNDSIGKLEVLARENGELREKVSVYEEYFDIKNPPTEEVKEEVSAKLKMKELEKKNQELKMMVNHLQSPLHYWMQMQLQNVPITCDIGTVNDPISMFKGY